MLYPTHFDLGIVPEGLLRVHALFPAHTAVNAYSHFRALPPPSEEAPPLLASVRATAGLLKS